MTTPKYKINASMLESVGEIRKLEHDGFSRETIMKSMYRETDGSNTQDRRKLVKKLFERGDC